MALIELAREVQRVVSTATDAEIQMLIDAAIADMRRVGIREGLLDPEDMSPLAKYAVIMHVKANYGHDDSESDRWWSRYERQVTALMNSSANECSGEASDGSQSSSPTDADPGGDSP